MSGFLLVKESVDRSQGGNPKEGSGLKAMAGRVEGTMVGGGSIAPFVEGHRYTEGSSVNKGYNRSVILNLAARSLALSKVILKKGGLDDDDQLMRMGTYHTPFRCIAPTFTTTRPFSFLSIPSRLPLDMPTTFSSFVPLIISLSMRREGNETKRFGYSMFVVGCLP